MNQQITQKAQLMIEKNGYAKQTKEGAFQVKSQFDESASYTVDRTGKGLRWGSKRWTPLLWKG